MTAAAVATPAAPAGGEAALSQRARERAARRKTQVLVTQLAIFVGVIAFWEIGARTKFIDEFFFGSPWGIVQRLYEWVNEGTAFGSIWFQIAVTIEEAVLGFFAGVIVGVILGVALGEIPFLADVLQPYIKALNALPRIVLGSIFVMWLGLGLPSKVMLAGVLVFFVVFFNAFQGVRSVDRNLVNNARILGASRLQVVTNVVIPSAMTWIIASLHVALGLAVIGAIVGEFLGSQYGLGLVIATAQNTFDANGVFGAMLIIGLIATGAEALMAQLEKKLLAWRPASAAESSARGL